MAGTRWLQDRGTGTGPAQAWGLRTGRWRCELGTEGGGGGGWELRFASSGKKNNTRPPPCMRQRAPATACGPRGPQLPGLRDLGMCVRAANGRTRYARLAPVLLV
jgi:hypothetical protein